MAAILPIVFLGVVAGLVVVGTLVLDEVEFWLRRARAYAAGRRHPEPIASWVRMALAQLDGGELWLDGLHSRAQWILRESWSIETRGDWARECVALLGRPGRLDAWNGLRALRITMLATRLGWVNEEFFWGLASVIAIELAHYENFSALARAYHEGLRMWLGTNAESASGMQHLSEYATNVAKFEARRWNGVAFTGLVVRDRTLLFDRAVACEGIRAIGTLRIGSELAPQQ